MFDVVQKPNESIRKFVERFNRETVDDSDLTDSVQIMGFVKALLPNLRLAFAFPKERNER